MTRKRRTDPRKIELSDLQAVAESQAGRRVLGRFLAESGLMNAVFHRDERMHVHAEGRRDYGIWMFNELKEVQEELPLSILKDFYYEQRCEPTTEPDFREPAADRPELSD